MSDLSPDQELFAEGDKVSYKYGTKKVHARVICYSKSGQRIRIAFKSPCNNWEEWVFVKPEKLERGHV